MRAALFGHNVDYFDEIIDVETCYDISNVVVAPVNDKVYEHYPDEKQMHINTLSSVKRLPVAEVPYPLIFNCTQISELPRDHVPLNVSFDLIAVVLEYVPPRKVPNKFSSKLSELRITDDSCSEVLHVSLYNDFALGLEILANVEPRQAVILLSGLKTKLSPDNHDMILSRSSISMKETTMSQVPMSTIECAMQMKANEITREEMVRISGFIPDFNDHSVRVSVCCNWCGKACENNLEESYFCDYCNQHVVATTKLFFDFTATDGTGSLKLASHIKNAEQLLKTKASVVYAMTTEERFNFTAELGTMFRATKTEMLLSPIVTLLEDHKVVKWILKYII